MNTADDLLRILAAANPLPSNADAALERSDRDALLQRIYATPPKRSRPTQSRNLLVAGISIVIAATVIPTAALSGRLGSLFDFSNPGTPDPTGGQALSNVRVADRLGLQPGSTMRLAERSGVFFYTIRGKDQGQCFGISSGPGGKPELTTLICPGPDGPASFPSPSRPVLDLSPRMGREGSTHMFFPSIIGFAADGVAEVGVVDPGGRTHTTPVDGNVYFTDDLAEVPAQAFVALNAEGEVIWRREAKGPNFRSTQPRQGG